MTFDDLDLKLLKTFYICANNGEKKLTSWKLMKKIYPKGSDTHHTNIRRKLIKFTNIGIMEYSKEDGFVLIRDFIKINEIPTLKNCVSLKIYGKWEIKEC